MVIRARLQAVLVGTVVVLLVPFAAGCLEEGEDVSFSSDLTAEAPRLYRIDSDQEVYGATSFTGTTEVDGQAAQVELLGHVSYVEGDGPFSGFVTLTFDDGSTLAIRHSGEADGEPDTSNATFRARLTIIGGTGRYDGARGSGRMDGERSAELGTAVRLHFDLEIKPGD